jgi:transaldolase
MSGGDQMSVKTPSSSPASLPDPAPPSTSKDPLYQTASTTATDYWNDSCSVEELTYAIERGAVGATTNPTIVGDVLKKEMHLWRERIAEIVAGNPTWTEDEITWRLIEEMAMRGAELLLPVFEREGGRKGRISIQTDPRLYRDSARITEQALRFSALAPNMQVKIPVTCAGVQAIEEVTAAGVNINATVCFTVPQALAVAEAVERGLQRREAAGEDVASMTPVCTLMVGRLDDWMEVLVKRDGVVADPGIVHWAGIACMKKAYGIVRERGYRTRLLAAAYRHHLHWSELIGGDVVLTIPYSWQRLFNASDIEVVPRMDDPVPESIVNELYRRFPDFRRAYDVDGMSPEEFDSYGAASRTLRGFIASYHDLVAVIRDFMLPNPDVK